MKKLKITLSILGALIILTITFFLGSFLGVSEAYLQDSALRGSLLATELQSLREGKLKLLIEQKETSLDLEVFLAMQSENKGYSWVLFPFYKDNQRLLKQIANYRKEHPSALINKSSEDKYQFVLANKELQEKYGVGAVQHK